MVTIFFQHILLALIVLSLSACTTQSPAPIEYGNSGSNNKSDDSGSTITEKEEESHKEKIMWGDKLEEVEKEEKQEKALVINDEVIPERTGDISHEVIEGETLDSIAKKYGVSKEAIIAKNNLKAPYELEELQILVIPPRNAVSLEIEDIIKPAKSPAPVGEAQVKHMPVDGKIISAFGENYQGSMNQGVNISAPIGSEIRSMTSGVVMHATKDAKFGNLVIVKSLDSDIFTAYAHMNDLQLKPGDNVELGQVIGHVGQTGKVSEPQLHFAIRKGKVPVDPVGYLNN